MNTKTLTALALTTLAIVTPARASHELAQKNSCLSCHTADKKLIGPAYRDVAKKYTGMKPEELAKSIKAGGANRWGPIPMPAQPQLSDHDALILATWILNGAK